MAVWRHWRCCCSWCQAFRMESCTLDAGTTRALKQAQSLLGECCKLYFLCECHAAFNCLQAGCLTASSQILLALLYMSMHACMYTRH